MKKLIGLFAFFLISMVSLAQVQIDSVVTVDESCPGACDGTLTIYTSNGTPTEMYDIGGTAQASNVFTGLCAAIYTVTVNDGLPSSDNTTATVSSPTPLTYTVSTFNCSAYGVCDGQATVTISGGTPPYLITYFDAGMTPLQAGTQTSIINLCAGTYFVDVTDANGCPATGPTGPSLTQFAITEPAPPTLVVSQWNQSPSCFSLCDGSSTLTASGGVPPYTYSWGTWVLGSLCDWDNIPAWTVTDAIGQQVSGPSQFIFTDPPTLTPIATDESCPGACDGVINGTSISGGNPPFTYALYDAIGNPLAGPQSTPLFNNLCPGSYNLVQTSSVGCNSGYPLTVNAATPITFILTTNNASAFGVCDGSNDVIISGGTAPYLITYYASNGTTVIQTGPSSLIAGLCAGNYYVDVTDANGCSSGTGLTAFTITEPAPPALSASETTYVNESCPGMCDGIIGLTISGGTPPYTVSWDGGPFTPTTLVNLCGGGYTWIVQDALGAQFSSGGFMGTNPLPTVLPIITTDESCVGFCDGTVNAQNVFGSNPPYQYSIDGISYQSSQIFNGLCFGNYILYIQDAGGCVGQDPFTINAATPLVVTVNNITNASCPGSCDGDATLNVSGGQAPYTYVWNTAPVCTSPNLGGCGVCTGTYSCTVTDANGCSTVINNITITQPAGTPITATFSTTSETCFGSCDGTASVVASGGLPPYTYQWDDPCLSTTATSTCAGCPGVYQCIITDANGCIYVVTGITVTGPSALMVSNSVTNVSCAGSCDGSISSSVSGATPPYSYSWIGPSASPSDTLATINNLCAGIYVVTIVDANGCNATDSVIVIEPTPLSISTTGVNPSCFGLCDGSITPTVTGGTPPYAYLWSPLGCASPTCGPLCAGIYSLIVTDANGCVAMKIDTLIDPPLLTASVTSVADVSCFGGCDGTVTLIASGGTPLYNYTWGASCTQPNLGACGCVSAGVYTGVVSDANGCIAVANVTINEPAPLVATATVISNPTGIGNCDGVINSSVTGGISPYFYIWYGCTPSFFTGIISQNAPFLCDGDYQVVVTDINGCEDTSACITIVDPPTSITENSNKYINKIYPNPTEGIITIDFSDKTSFPLTFQVIDINGKIVQEKTFNNNNSATLNLSSLPKGIYILSNATLLIKRTIILE